MKNLMLLRLILLPLLLVIIYRELAVAADREVTRHTVDVTQMVSRISASTGWKFIGFQSGQRSPKKLFVFEVSEHGRPFAHVEIVDLADLLEKIEAWGNPRVLRNDGRYYFPELERRAVAEISRLTGWNYKILEDATTFSVWFDGGKDGMVQTESPSELLEKIRTYGRAKGTHGYVVFFPDHERAVAEEIGRRFGLAVSVRESQTTVRATFTESSRGLSFSTENNAESLQKFLSHSDSQVRLKRLFDVELFVAAKALADSRGWTLYDVVFKSGKLSFFYYTDQRHLSVFETNNPRKALQKFAFRCTALFAL